MPIVRKATAAELANRETIHPVTEAQLAEAILAMRDVLAKHRKEVEQLRREVAALRAQVSAYNLEFMRKQHVPPRRKQKYTRQKSK